MLAAILALASCGQSRAAPTPTIEYRTVTHGNQQAVASGDVGMAVATPRAPACAIGCKSPTQTPTDTPTPIPIATPAPATIESQAVAPTSTDNAATTPPIATNTAPNTTYAGQCGWDFDATAIAWWAEITRYPWDACTALRIIQRESHGLNVYNYQDSGACGVMQLLPCEYPEDGAANIAFGYWDKYVPALAAWGDGWQPWAVDP